MFDHVATHYQFEASLQRKIGDVFTKAFHARNSEAAGPALIALESSAVEHGNTFEALMDACKVCSLGQLSNALYDVGGRYRRNM